MVIIGLILGFVGLAYLCWLLFALAVYALPLRCCHRWACRLSQRFGTDRAILVGAIASSITLVAGQIAFTTLRSPLIRAAIALLFAVPAAVAGYHAALGLASICVPDEFWRHAIAVMAAIIVAATAGARMAFSAPPDAGQGMPPASHARSADVVGQAGLKASPPIVSMASIAPISDRILTMGRLLAAFRLTRRGASHARETFSVVRRCVPEAGACSSRPSVRQDFFSFARRAWPLVQVTRYPPRLLLDAVGPARATWPLMA